MRVTKRSQTTGVEILIPLADALAQLRAFNIEFTRGKNDDELVAILKTGWIYTMLNAFTIRGE